MELRFSTVARDRRFSKAMRRIRPRFAPLVEAFALVDLTDSIHQAILVIVTDERGPECFEEMPNSDGFFQVMAGVRIGQSDLELTRDVFCILRRAATLCPFSKPDHETMQRLFDDAEARIIGE
jgi:hypothetical protein